MARGKAGYLLSFSLACSLRAIPELASPAYPVGYDSALYAYKIAHTMEEPFICLLRTSAFFRILCWALLELVRADAYLLLKVVGPITYGLLALSFYALLRRGLGFGEREALLGVVICCLQIPSLRLSWDLFRNELGLAFAFAFMTFIVSYNGKLKWPLASLLAFLAAFSHQLASFLILIWSPWWAIRELGPDGKNVRNLLLVLLPPAGLFTYQVATYLRILPPPCVDEVGHEVIRLEPVGLQEPPPRPFRNYFSSASLLGASYGHLVFVVLKVAAVCYLPILPLALLGLRHRDRMLDPLVAWPSLAVATVLICPQAYPFYSFFRWLLFLVFPLSAYAIRGVEELELKTGRWREILLLFLLAYSIMGLGYASGTAFRIEDKDINAFLPWSLVESTIGVGQIDDCIACLRWLNREAGDEAVLIAEQRFYAWALSTLDERIVIAFYPHGYPLGRIPLSELTGEFEEIYLIWYSGQRVEGFIQVFSRGDIAIYVLVAGGP